MQQKVIYKAKVQIGSKVKPGKMFEKDDDGLYQTIPDRSDFFCLSDIVENSPDIFEKVIQREIGEWYVGLLKDESHRRVVYYDGNRFSGWKEPHFSYLSTEPIDLDKY